MRSRVLIVSELFYPNNVVGALRASKLSKYLLKMGYEVDVLTSEIAMGIYTQTNCRVYTVNEKKDQSESHSNSKTLRILKQHPKLYDIFVSVGIQRVKNELQSIFESIKFKREAVRLFQNKVINPSDYDACITTYGPLSSVLIGLELKKKYKVRKWICDFRDPMIVEDTPNILKPFLCLLQADCLRFADKIVAISNGVMHGLSSTEYCEKTYIIPNGYDLEDIPNANVQQLSKAKFVITYVGTLYGGKRKLSPLFRAIADLHSSGQIDLTQIDFNYAGNELTILKRQAAEFGVDCIVEDLGILGREQCITTQFQSSMLVLSTWNTKREQGVFTGKFLEYMMIGKPIIGIITGDCPESEVAEVIEEGNLGIAFEEANEAIDFLKLKDYIKHQYDSYFQNGMIEFSPNQAVIERYDYRNIVEKFEALINDQ